MKKWITIIVLATLMLTGCKARTIYLEPQTITQDYSTTTNNHEYYYENFTNVTVKDGNYIDMLGMSRLCFHNSNTCLENGTEGFIWFTNYSTDYSNNRLGKFKAKGLLLTTFSELSPNASMYWGYPDLDKGIVYNTSRDTLHFFSDVSYEFHGANIDLLENATIEADNRLYFGWPDKDKFIQYRSDTDRLEYRTDNDITSEHYFRGGNVVLERDLYIDGSDIRTSSGSLWLQPATYIGLRANANQDIRMDIGDDLLINDRDDSYATRLTFDTATGDLDITGDFRADGEGYITDNVYYDHSTITTAQNWTGTESDLNTCLEGGYITINEDTGSDPLNITFDFDGVTSFRNIVVCWEYTGSHDVHLAIYNTNTGVYQDMNDMGLTDTINCNYKSVGGNDLAMINSGTVNIRAYHPQNGVNSHDLILDCIKLER